MTPITFRIRELRLAKGLTQQQLASAAKVRQGTVSDLERGKGRRVDLDILERLAMALGVASVELFGERGSKRRRSAAGAQKA